MNQKFFLAAMSIRNHANSISKRVVGLLAMDQTGYFYKVLYENNEFQYFKISMQNAEIVYIAPINEEI